MTTLRKYFALGDSSLLTDLLILCCSSITSVFFFLYFYQKHYILLYDDAASHLNIAKRVIDGMSSGFAQFGAVWLPLQHFLMLPFIWDNFLWHSGIAGSIISMASYIVTIIMSFKTAKLFTGSTWGGVVSAVIIGTNVNFLYLQTTPLGEPLMLAVVTLCFYFLLAWTRSSAIPHLVLAAFFAFLASLTRYEGWFLVIFCAAYVFFVQYRKTTYHKAESMTFLFCSLAFLGILLWIVYSWVLMGSPLYFLTGPFSAHTQQNAIAAAGGLPTRHNIGLSFLVYWWDVVDTLGISVVIISIVSFVLAFFQKQNRQQIPYLLTMLSLPALIVFTLILGITVIYVPQLPIHHVQGGLFNVRYGIMALPFAAFAGSLLVAKRPWLALMIIAIIIAQQFYLFTTHNINTVNDGLRGASAMRFSSDDTAFFQKLRSVCNNQPILMTQVSHDPQLFATGIDMRYFITEAAYGYWQTSLKDPTRFATCIVMGTHDNPHDTIRSALAHNKKFLQSYALAYQNNTYLLYKRL